ncbi:hypothetical protein SAV14893_078380 [Streptomyces avermitilis]|uniref:Uncharacterized protein n=1 Tax=Streptomyces avermitilis TaxID=33903 RepID=A0A4D4MGL2_STRAX|nr:hypothetical protein SAV14893_078380 [Streptomyces avermitilis]GDY71182.1 hypothetical protein SAV31267_006670 [Streptomyces avermitilis]
MDRYRATRRGRRSSLGIAAKAWSSPPPVPWRRVGRSTRRTGIRLRAMRAALSQKTARQPRPVATAWAPICMMTAAASMPLVMQVRAVPRRCGAMWWTA